MPEIGAAPSRDPFGGRRVFCCLPVAYHIRCDSLARSGKRGKYRLAEWILDRAELICILTLARATNSG
jgi:hypothetical protein